MRQDRNHHSHLLAAAMAPALAVLGLFAVGAAGAAEPPSVEARFAPIAPMIGHCWTAPIGDAGLRDVQCYEWMYERAFVRNTHIIEGGKTPYQGTTIYSWDGAHQRLRYHYFTSTGAVSEGQVEMADATPVFIEAHTDTAGKVIRLRSEVRFDGDRAFIVQTRRLDGDGDAPAAVRTYRRNDGETRIDGQPAPGNTNPLGMR